MPDFNPISAIGSGMGKYFQFNFGGFPVGLPTYSAARKIGISPGTAFGTSLLTTSAFSYAGNRALVGRNPDDRQRAFELDWLDNAYRYSIEPILGNQGKKPYNYGTYLDNVQRRNVPESQWLSEDEFQAWRDREKEGGWIARVDAPGASEIKGRGTLTLFGRTFANPFDAPEIRSALGDEGVDKLTTGTGLVSLGTSAAYLKNLQAATKSGAELSNLAKLSGLGAASLKGLGVAGSVLSAVDDYSESIKSGDSPLRATVNAGSSGVTGFTAASTAATVGAPLLGMGPLGWLGYGGLVVGSGLAGQFAGGWTSDRILDIAGEGKDKLQSQPNLGQSFSDLTDSVLSSMSGSNRLNIGTPASDTLQTHRDVLLQRNKLSPSSDISDSDLLTLDTRKFGNDKYNSGSDMPRNNYSNNNSRYNNSGNTIITGGWKGDQRYQAELQSQKLQDARERDLAGDRLKQQYALGLDKNVRDETVGLDRNKWTGIVGLDRNFRDQQVGFDKNIRGQQEQRFKTLADYQKDLRGQDIQSGDRRYDTDVRSGDRRYETDTKYATEKWKYQNVDQTKLAEAKIKASPEDYMSEDALSRKVNNERRVLNIANDQRYFDNQMKIAEFNAKYGRSNEDRLQAGVDKWNARQDQLAKEQRAASEREKDRMQSQKQFLAQQQVEIQRRADAMQMYQQQRQDKQQEYQQAEARYQQQRQDYYGQRAYDRWDAMQARNQAQSNYQQQTDRQYQLQRESIAAQNTARERDYNLRYQEFMQRLKLQRDQFDFSKQQYADKRSDQLAANALAVRARTAIGAGY